MVGGGGVQAYAGERPHVTRGLQVVALAGGGRQSGGGSR